MPFIKITSLRGVKESAETMNYIEGALYGADLDGKPLMPLRMATCIWCTADSVVHGGEAFFEHQLNRKEFPIFVDLYVNAMFSKKAVGLIMEMIANGLGNHPDIDRDNVFIHTHVAEAGYVFINGKVTTDFSDL